MYAVIEVNTKQYLVSQDETIRIEKIDKNIGDSIVFDKVLMVNKEDNVEIGSPYVENAKAVGVVLAQDREKKIIVFKKKRRKGYKKTMGHRQYFTGIKITEIGIG